MALAAEHVKMVEAGSLLPRIHVGSSSTGSTMHACTGRERLSQARDFLAFWECFALFDLPLCGQALNCALSGLQEEVFRACVCDEDWEGGTHPLTMHICKGLSLVIIFVLFPLSVWRK